MYLNIWLELYLPVLVHGYYSQFTVQASDEQHEKAVRLTAWTEQTQSGRYSYSVTGTYSH